MSPARLMRAAFWAAALMLLLAGLGRRMTDIGPWYLALQQPGWKPPDALFGPAWALIFTLTGAAAVVAWRAEPARASRRRLLMLFAINGALNVLWSALFFQAKRPDWALMEVGLLWLSILALVVVLGQASRLAGALMLPYLLWVSFAAALNAETVRLNGPF